jgi:hypothetical protein
MRKHQIDEQFEAISQSENNNLEHSATQSCKTENLHDANKKAPPL